MDLYQIIEEIRKEYTHKIELHAHTNPVSGCSRYRPVDMVRKHKEMGYSALAITNHFQPGMLKRSEDDAVEFFMNDFREAYAEGERIGLKVILGVEAHFVERPNDYLVYGIEENDIRTLYRYIGKSCSEYYADCKNDRNVIIQAHPCRKNLVYTPDCIDGVEAYNLHPAHNSVVALSARYSCRDKKVQIAGSDLHHPGNEGLAAIMTRRIPKDSFDLAAIIKSGDFVISVDDDIILQRNYGNLV